MARLTDYLRALGVACAVLLQSVCGASAEIYTPTVFYRDVSVGTWTAVDGLQAGPWTNGVYTNTSVLVTNVYRLSATNRAGRLPFSTNTTCVLAPHVTLTNAFRLTWNRKPGIQAHIVERSLDAGTTWTNWIPLGPSATNLVDTGTNAWQSGSITSTVPLIASPAVPWQIKGTNTPLAGYVLKFDGVAGYYYGPDNATTGGADMATSIYDTNSNGRVDSSDDYHAGRLGDVRTNAAGSINADLSIGAGGKLRVRWLYPSNGVSDNLNVRLDVENGQWQENLGPASWLKTADMYSRMLYGAWSIDGAGANPPSLNIASNPVIAADGSLTNVPALTFKPDGTRQTTAWTPAATGAVARLAALNIASNAIVRYASDGSYQTSYGSNVSAALFGVAGGDGDIVAFGPGAYRASPADRVLAWPIPVIAGAGREATTLLVPRGITTSGSNSMSLVLQDITLGSETNWTVATPVPSALGILSLDNAEIVDGTAGGVLWTGVTTLSQISLNGNSTLGTLLSTVGTGSARPSITLAGGALVGPVAGAVATNYTWPVQAVSLQLPIGGLATGITDVATPPGRSNDWQLVTPGYLQREAAAAGWGDVVAGSVAVFGSTTSAPLEILEFQGDVVSGLDTSTPGRAVVTIAESARSSFSTSLSQLNMTEASTYQLGSTSNLAYGTWLLWANLECEQIDANGLQLWISFSGPGVVDPVREHTIVQHSSADWTLDLGPVVATVTSATDVVRLSVQSFFATGGGEDISSASRLRGVRLGP